jgi:glutathione S-transferase
MATLYYFGGRGLADQMRWMLAATNVSFTQKVISTRPQFVKMAERQLPFGQLPLLQIDGHEIVQSQAAIRYLARRARLVGANTEEELKCDMIAESVKDLISLVSGTPFKRNKGQAELKEHVEMMKKKWEFTSGRYEAILRMSDKKEFMVGNSLTYADILVAHVATWFIEECGSDIVNNTPYLVNLQVKVISLPGINEFIKSKNYYAVGDDKYCEQVCTVLGRAI